MAGCAHHQKYLIRSAIDLDTFVTSNKKFKTSAFNPAALCRDVVARQSHAAREGVETVLESTLGDGCAVGNPSQLSLVLSNLLSSASCDARARTVSLTASVVQDDTRTQTLRFSVAHDGSHLPPSSLRSFFGSPGQLGNVGAQIKEFGFGVYVAEEFVKRMRGVLVLRSPVLLGGWGEGGEGGRREGEDTGEEGTSTAGVGSEVSFQISVRKIESGSKGVPTPKKGVGGRNGEAEERRRWRKEEGEEDHPQGRGREDDDSSPESYQDGEEEGSSDGSVGEWAEDRMAE